MVVTDRSESGWIEKLVITLKFHQQFAINRAEFENTV